jgi:hypothetical protein
MDKNQRATEAHAALGLTPGTALSLTSLIDMLKQEYNTHIEQARDCQERGLIGACRVHVGSAGTLAEMLSRISQATSYPDAAQDWSQRAQRLQRRAYQSRNKISENIGATMP